jgi:hypothetical protein
MNVMACTSSRAPGARERTDAGYRSPVHPRWNTMQQGDLVGGAQTHGGGGAATRPAENPLARVEGRMHGAPANPCAAPAPYAHSSTATMNVRSVPILPAAGTPACSIHPDRPSRTLVELPEAAPESIFKVPKVGQGSWELLTLKERDRERLQRIAEMRRTLAALALLASACPAGAFLLAPGISHARAFAPPPRGAPRACASKPLFAWAANSRGGRRGRCSGPATSHRAPCGHVRPRCRAQVASCAPPPAGGRGTRCSSCKHRTSPRSPWWALAGAAGRRRKRCAKTAAMSRVSACLSCLLRPRDDPLHPPCAPARSGFLVARTCTCKPAPQGPWPLARSYDAM